MPSTAESRQNAHILFDGNPVPVDEEKLRKPIPLIYNILYGLKRK